MDGCLATHAKYRQPTNHSDLNSLPTVRSKGRQTQLTAASVPLLHSTCSAARAGLAHTNNTAPQSVVPCTVC